MSKFAPTHASQVAECDHELRFRSIAISGRAFAFPCDAQGSVRLDVLSERARANYFYARTLVGLDLLTPVVMRVCDAQEVPR